MNPVLVKIKEIIRNQINVANAIYAPYSIRFRLFSESITTLKTVIKNKMAFMLVIFVIKPARKPLNLSRFFDSLIVNSLLLNIELIPKNNK